MRFSVRLATTSAIIIALLALLGGVCWKIFSNQRGMLDDMVRRSDSERASLDALHRITDIQMNLYKALNWSASGYDETLTTNLLQEQVHEVGLIKQTLQGFLEVDIFDPEEVEMAGQVEVSLEAYTYWMMQVVDMCTVDTATATMLMGSAESTFQAMQGELARMTRHATEMSRAESAHAAHVSRLLLLLFAAAFSVTVLVVCGVSLFLFRTTAVPIQRIVNELTGVVRLVSSHASVLAEGSKRSADGAGNQSASLEETSAAMREMAAMTARNADHAQQADGLMGEVKQVVGNGSTAVEEVSGAIGKIHRSAEETAPIVKTIDEIAFQTNLLALNAAVEAARAGATGKGFAVVAEEVRNLAKRTAEAARETAERIESSRRDADTCVKVVDHLASTFLGIEKSAGKAVTLVGRIATASKEQAQGIEQANTGIVEMDKVVQVNACSAEETAGVARELSGQACELKAMVEILLGMVGGSGSSARSPGTPGPPSPPDHRSTHRAP